MNQRNEQGQKHGYWEGYYSDGQLNWKDHFKDDKKEGYWESYFFDGQLQYKEFYARI